jgi:hypothetical protein
MRGLELQKQVGAVSAVSASELEAVGIAVLTAALAIFAFSAISATAIRFAARKVSEVSEGRHEILVELIVGISAIPAIPASDSPISARAVSPKGYTPRDIKFVFRNFRYPASAPPSPPGRRR